LSVVEFDGVWKFVDDLGHSIVRVVLGLLQSVVREVDIVPSSCLVLMDFQSGVKVVVYAM
jgi:hypothetical protein